MYSPENCDYNSNQFDYSANVVVIPFSGNELHFYNNGYGNQYIYSNIQFGLRTNGTTQMIVVPDIENVSSYWNSHNAHLNVLQISSGLIKNDTKEKSTIFTTEQVTILENLFKQQQYITAEERKYFAEELHICEHALMVWFQNRREKEKRDQLEQKAYTEDNAYQYVARQAIPSTDPLSYVEYLNNNPNEFGYVTLDNRAINDLARAIDDVLPKHLSIHEIMGEENTSSIVIDPKYELLSPTI